MVGGGEGKHSVQAVAGGVPSCTGQRPMGKAGHVVVGRPSPEWRLLAKVRPRRSVIPIPVLGGTASA